MPDFTCCVAMLRAIKDAVKLACMLDLNTCSAMALHAAAIQHQDQPRADVMILMVEQAKKMDSRAADTIQAALSHELGQSTSGKQKQHAFQQEWYRYHSHSECCIPLGFQLQYRLVVQPASLIGVTIKRLVRIYD